MATFEIKTKHTMNTQAEYVDAGLSAHISSMFSNPFDEADKNRKAFIRIYGIDFKPNEYLSSEYFNVERI